VLGRGAKTQVHFIDIGSPAWILDLVAVR
jgi:hypothetical protein